MWPIKRKKNEPVKEQVANPPPRRSIDTLLNKEAAWGSSFRTVTFTSAEEDPLARQFNLQAIRTADKQWTVLRVTTSRPPHQKNASDTIKTTKVDRADIRFLQALDHLANFEATEPGLGHIQAVPGEKESLGFEHYQAFGEREGLLFDQRGLPHETRNGMIITQGEFTQADQESFEKNFRQTDEEKRASKARQAGETHLALMQAFSGAGNTGLAGFSGGWVEQSEFDEVLVRLRKRDRFTELKKRIDNAVMWWKQSIEYGFRDDRNRYFEEEISAAEKVLPLFEEDVSILARSLKICRFAAKMQQAQQAFHFRAKGVTNEATLLAVKQESEKLMQELGISNTSEIVASLMLQHFDNKPESIPEFVLSFVEQIKKTEEILTNEARQLAQGHTQPLEEAGNEEKQLTEGGFRHHGRSPGMVY